MVNYKIDKNSLNTYSSQLYSQHKFTDKVDVRCCNGIDFWIILNVSTRWSMLLNDTHI